MMQILSVGIAIVSIIMAVFNYGTDTETIAWILAFVGWTAVSIFQGEKERGNC